MFAFGKLSAFYFFDRVGNEGPSVDLLLTIRNGSLATRANYARLRPPDFLLDTFAPELTNCHDLHNKSRNDWLSILGNRTSTLG